MLNIWNKRIQGLVLSNRQDAIRLAYYLLEDKNSLFYWCDLGDLYASRVNLPKWESPYWHLEDIVNDDGPEDSYSVINSIDYLTRLKETI